MTQQAHNTLSRPLRAARGFTLIELMITVAVVAILVAVALPSYGSYVKRSNRAEAQAYLMTVAGRQQQFMIDTRAYAALADVGVAVPDRVAANYTLEIDIEAGPPPGFVITASPKTAQADEACGTLTINQAGVKTAAVENCW